MAEATTAKRGRPTRNERRNGRDQLLDAARTEFGTRGYGNTTIDQLLATAGVNPPTLYHHFGGKRGLFVEAARRAYGEVLDDFRAAVPLSAETDFDVALDAVLDASIRMMGQDPGLARLFLVIQFELPRQPGLAGDLRATLREFRGFFDDIAARAPSSLAATKTQRRDLSRALVSIINGLNGEALLLTRPEDFPRVVERMRALLHVTAQTAGD